MGQKVHPIGIRLGIVKEAVSTWYANSKEFGALLLQDIEVRKYLTQHYSQAMISKVKIERPAKNAKITVCAARPGIIIGKKGEGTNALKKVLEEKIKVPVHINIEEVRKPEADAKIVAETIASQLERRVMFRRAMKRSITSAMQAGAKGVKIIVSGRLGGAEIARSEWYKEGRVPLHTFRADIDYATARAKTTYGIIGVKVWIFKGEILDKKETRKKTVEEKG